MNPYQDQFLASQSVLAMAAARLPDDNDLTAFIELIYRDRRNTSPKGVVLEEALAWYLFEEFGWPEGRAYFYDSLMAGSGTANAHYLRMLRRPAPKIDARLELRRLHWHRPKKVAFLAAHAMLLDTLENTFPTQPPDHAR
jgi:hypothetical protein